MNTNSTDEERLNFVIYFFFLPSATKLEFSNTRFAEMKEFTFSFEVLGSLGASIVLLIQDVKALFESIVDDVVFAKVNLSIVIDHVLFTELKERSVTLVNVIQELFNFNRTNFEIDWFGFLVVIDLNFTVEILTFIGPDTFQNIESRSLFGLFYL